MSRSFRQIVMAVLGSLSLLSPHVFADQGVFPGAGTGDSLPAVPVPVFPAFPEPVTRLGEDSRGTIFYQTRSPYDLDLLFSNFDSTRKTTGVGYLMMPRDASAEKPVPAMVILHGSGGISPGREMEYGRMLAEAGYAAFVVDYYLPRGVTPKTPYMVATTTVTEFDALTDAYHALELLSTHPAIDGESVGVMGFSYGGMATRIAMDDRLRQIITPGHSGFAAHADFYGPCFQVFGTEKTNGAPLLTLRGTEDKSVTISDCKKREAEIAELGVEVEAIVYEGAGHAWDAGVPKKTYPNPYVAGCDIIYDKQGVPFVNGEPLIRVTGSETVQQRTAMRIQSGEVMGKCVGQGYLIGWDPDVKDQSDAALLYFLEKHLKNTD